MKNRKQVGSFGEERAVNFLTRIGFSILRKNYRTPSGEIDIIAQDGDTIVFVEVKTRRSLTFGRPEESVDECKRQQIKKVAQQFISQYQLFHFNCRFDIITIYDEGKSVDLKYMRSAFY